MDDKTTYNYKEDSYPYMYHLSNHRSNDQKWACMIRENYTSYFNNPISVKIGYGETPELAFKNVKDLEDE